ncbi:MAG: ATP-binding protein [Acetobacteraceae bacterium]|nr:ATP-binding protein [Acetobacteraceae bacterium]
MTIAIPAYPEAAPLHGSEEDAWLEWNLDLDRLHLSSGALRLLQLSESQALMNENDFRRLFDKHNRNKLTIALEDILTQQAPVSVELLRQTTASPQVILFRGELDRSREDSIVVVRLEDVTGSSHCLQLVATKKRFETFVSLIEKDPTYFDSVPLGLMMVNAGFITQANPKLADILSIHIGSLIGEPVSRILSSKQSYDYYMESVWGEATEDSQEFVETEFENDSGTLLWLRISVSRICTSGSDHACLCVIEDITARKKLEQDVWAGLAETLSAKEATDNASRMKSEFLAMVSHEIRTPLSAVIGMQKLALRDPGLKEKTRQHLDMAQTNAEFLLELLNDILDFSKIEAGKLPLESVDFSLRHLITDSTALLMERAASKNISLTIDTDSAVPDTLVGDPARLKQILINLIGNGIKFTDKGGVALRVQLESSVADISNILFEVEDTGIGIPREAQSQLFQKFAQGDTSTTRRFGGTGLGLVICKQLVELMQGEISLKSELGKGSCFSFVIPFKIGSAPANILPVVLVPHSHQLNVLCAEDFHPNQIIIQGLLDEMGHRVEFADNGRKALEALALRSYDVILMDGRMPEMDGATAIRLIRSEGDGQYYIPDPNIRIIMLTANAGDESRQFYMASGADDFLVKPINENLLHQSLARVIEARLAEGASLLPIVRNRQQELEKLFGIIAPEGVGAAQFLPVAPAINPHEENKNLRERLRQALRADLGARLKALDGAYAKRDMQTLGNLFHSLKGSAGYILPEGALQHMSAELEQAADREDWHTIEKELPGFLNMLNEISEGTIS